MVPGNKGGILESNHRIYLCLQNLNMYAGRYLYMQVDLYMQIDLYMKVDICINLYMYAGRYLYNL